MPGNTEGYIPLKIIKFLRQKIKEHSGFMSVMKRDKSWRTTWACLDKTKIYAILITSQTSHKEAMMHTWQLQEAKSRLSEVVRLCVQEGPQILTVRGKEEVVLLSKQDYEFLLGSKPNLFKFMRSSPLKEVKISFERDQTKIRDINL